MKWFILGALILGCSGVQAKNCEVPISKIEVGSVKLLQSFGNFRQQHPLAKANKDSIFMADIDDVFAQEGVIYVGSLDYDALKNRIIGFTLNYTDGKYADLDTPIAQFKNTILKNSNLPKQGWVLSRDKEEYQYSCADYKVFIRQDHGMNRGSVGAVVWVFSRYSEFF